MPRHLVRRLAFVILVERFKPLLVAVVLAVLLPLAAKAFANHNTYRADIVTQLLAQFIVRNFALDLETRVLPQHLGADHAAFIGRNARVAVSVLAGGGDLVRAWSLCRHQL